MTGKCSNLARLGCVVKPLRPCHSCLLKGTVLCRFTELAKLVDPSNEPKTDKLSILGEAIRYVQQTQVENSQLKQLNKFLEVCILYRSAISFCSLVM